MIYIHIYESSISSLRIGLVPAAVGGTSIDAWVCVLWGGVGGYKKTHTRTHTHTHTTYPGIYTCICVYTYIYVYTNIFVHVYIYIHIYIRTHTNTLIYMHNAAVGGTWVEFAAAQTQRAGPS